MIVGRQQMPSCLYKSMAFLKKVVKPTQESSLINKAAVLSIIVLFAMEQLFHLNVTNGKIIKDGKYLTTDLFQESLK